ncbi:MAG: MATE family efflux transporter [Oscillospiraceae bacterium]|nr:MATE family efflux transporter [Oscillospiraceae bacterium]
MIDTKQKSEAEPAQLAMPAGDPAAADIEMPAHYAAERLGTEPVGRLLLRFAAPAVTGMVVNALYNVVDRIFVGRGVGEAALGGLALAMPLMTISMAFSMLFGVGAANMISIRLGQQRREEAENALNHCLLLLVGSGLLFMALGLVFLEPLFALMGAQEGSEAIAYAQDYFRIILYGQVFSMVGFGLSHCSRAQGFPMVTMVGMIIGAGMNMVLDPLFIFVFHWGVGGAAWATIISQLAAAVWVLSFNFSKRAVIKLRPKTFRPSLRIVGHIMSFGSAQFLLQVAASCVQFLYNFSMSLYGVAALGVANGGDVALSGMNIVSSVILMILMPVFGINQGAQPILGYNYGAKKFDRVRKAYLLAVTAATAICCVGFLASVLFPDAIIRLFAPDGSPSLLTFTPRAMRVVMLMLPVTGFQIVSSNMFIVTGRPKTSIVLSMLRQVIVLIPSLLLFGWLWGLNGVLAATPVADGVAALVAGAMIAIELRNLKAGMDT